MGALDEVLDRLRELDPEERRRIEEEALTETAALPWIPNPGSQADAYYCEADEIGYGGEAGPGKTDLIVGLSLTAHRRSLVLRRKNKDAKQLLERYIEILGHRRGLNEQAGKWRLPGRRILDIGGCEHEDNKQDYKGFPRDLIAFDEVVDFTESIYTFVIQWCRTTDPSQRTRVVATFNPPTKPTGLWVMRRWGPWLDPHHPRPAKSGEIRWYTTIRGEDTEVNGAGPHKIPGEKKLVMAKSRTFIRGHLEENPDLERTGYDATRAAAPKAMRAAYREGDFEASLADVPNQVIPSAWVRAAQRRWTDRPPISVPMCCIGDDASGGGDDPMALAIRHDGWYAPIIVVKGEEIPQDRAGKHCAGIIMSYRRDDAGVIVDMGGGYGASTYEQLKENNIDVRAFKGAEASTQRTKPDQQLGFSNMRTQVYWRFREALDPGQPNGSSVALPDDSELFADLTAPTFLEDRKLITLEAKEKVIERLGRSPNKGDAVVMAWHYGPRYISDGVPLPTAEQLGRIRGRYPQVIMGRNRVARRR
jgi:hypothetical protein